jgi:hypothetical protein
MSREYYSKEDIIEGYLIDGANFKLALFCIKENQPYLFDAKFLGYNDETNELQYQVQGNTPSWVDLEDVIQLGKDYKYSSYK